MKEFHVPFNIFWLKLLKATSTNLSKVNFVHMKKENQLLKQVDVKQPQLFQWKMLRTEKKVQKTHADKAYLSGLSIQVRLKLIVIQSILLGYSSVLHCKENTQMWAPAGSCLWITAHNMTMSYHHHFLLHKKPHSLQLHMSVTGRTTLLIIIMASGTNAFDVPWIIYW